jgi:lactate dehydrogenase-like 2-hydroxyacid dehydrogenase
MAHFGFGMRVLAGGRRSAAEIETGEGRQLSEMIAACGVEQYATDLEALVRACEVLSVHLPVTSATRHFLNAERLAWLKPTALLVNTARGAIVDEAALFDALVAGRLAGAALDVFVVEPYCPVQPDKDLRRLDNVVLTPHIGSNTHEANARMAYACVENLRHFFAGRWERLSRVT